jgi:hypothetical protein
MNTPITILKTTGPLKLITDGKTSGWVKHNWINLDGSINKEAQAALSKGKPYNGTEHALTIKIWVAEGMAETHARIALKEKESKGGFHTWKAEQYRVEAVKLRAQR